MAAAVDIPAIVLWGETVEDIWRPTNEKVVIVKKSGGLAAIEIEDVIVELQRTLSD